MTARGLILGALTLAMGSSGRAYTTEDLALAEDLARRAAIAVDNARLFEEAERARVLAEEARLQAVRANRAKSAFLATMSHEIRTPINAVLGYSQLMAMGIHGPLTPEQSSHLIRIQASTRHLLGIVEEILDLSRIEAGSLRVALSAVSAVEVAHAAIAMVNSAATARQIGLGFRPELAPVCLADEGRLLQILGNLLTNAVKFTSPGGSVALSVGVSLFMTPHPSIPLKPGVEYVCFTVRDTGIGIDKSQLERIFEPFVQAEDDQKNYYSREHDGAGLGLSISRDLARIMDGDITAESTPSEGSSFTLWLRVAPNEAPRV